MCRSASWDAAGASPPALARNNDLEELARMCKRNALQNLLQMDTAKQLEVRRSFFEAPAAAAQQRLVPKYIKNSLNPIHLMRSNRQIVISCVLPTRDYNCYRGAYNKTDYYKPNANCTASTIRKLLSHGAATSRVGLANCRECRSGTRVVVQVQVHTVSKLNALAPLCLYDVHHV